MTSTSLLWFRRDLRLGDHPALAAAADHNHRVLGVFVADDVPQSEVVAFLKEKLPK